MENKLLKKITDSINNFTGILLIILTAITFYEVISRYIFNKPWIYSNGLTMLIFPWMIFISAISITADKNHLSIEYFRGLLPKKIKTFVMYVSEVWILGFLIYMFFSGLEITIFNYCKNNQFLNISQSFFYASLPISFGSMVIVKIYHIINLIKSK